MCDHDPDRAPSVDEADSPTLRAYCDPGGRTALSTTVATLLAERLDAEVDACWNALYDSIDPEALDALFRPRWDGTPRRGGTLSFAVAAHLVTVRSDGHVLVEPSSTD